MPKGHIVWDCKLCGASGTIDPVNDVKTAHEGMLEVHRLLSPACPNAQQTSDAAVLNTDYSYGFQKRPPSINS